MPVGIYERRSIPLEVKFWPKVQKAESGCWLWTGSKNNLGYGNFWVGNKCKKAHIVAYELLKGPIPEELELDHLCRNRACVNPDHLEPVTTRENIRRSTLPQVNRDKQLAKTHCPQGHPYDLLNTWFSKEGYRKCRQCWRDQNNRRPR